MSTYFGRLVARASGAETALLPAPPRPRMDAVDPFEATAPSEPADVSPVAPPISRISDLATEIHASPDTPVATSTPRPLTAPVSEIALSAPRHVDAPVQPESQRRIAAPVVPNASPEVITPAPHAPPPATVQPPLVRPSEPIGVAVPRAAMAIAPVVVERVTALQSAPDAPAPAQPAVLQPRAERLPAAAPTFEPPPAGSPPRQMLAPPVAEQPLAIERAAHAPRLSIGRIEVDVLPAAPPTPPQIVQVIHRAPSASRPAPVPSQLHFGLGQM